MKDLEGFYWEENKKMDVVGVICDIVTGEPSREVFRGPQAIMAAYPTTGPCATGKSYFYQLYCVKRNGKII